MVESRRRSPRQQLVDISEQKPSLAELIEGTKLNKAQGRAWGIIEDMDFSDSKLLPTQAHLFSFAF